LTSPAMFGIGQAARHRIIAPWSRALGSRSWRVPGQGPGRVPPRVLDLRQSVMDPGEAEARRSSSRTHARGPPAPSRRQARRWPRARARGGRPKRLTENRIG
jgi:hypothetical protein